jgi:hypothetical protein
VTLAASHPIGKDLVIYDRDDLGFYSHHLPTNRLEASASALNS